MTVGAVLGEARIAQLRRAYLSLGTGELFASAVFIGIAVLTIAPRLRAGEWPALWVPLGVLVFVLVQGAVFWLAARSWVGRSVMPRGLARVFAALTWANWGLVAIALLVLALRWPADPVAALVCLLAGLMAAIEVVNYFVARLSYPVGRWFSEVGRWRTPRLVLDVRESLSRP